MKRAIVLLSASTFVLVAAFAAPSPARAQQVGKIAVVNSAQAFQDSAEGKRVIAQFQARSAKIQAELKRMDDAILATQSRLSTGQVTMTPEALAALQVDLNKRSTERKRYEEDQTRDFTQFRDGLVQPVQKEMVEILKSIRKDKGYDLILDLTVCGAVDFEPAIDLTAELVRRYDASKAAAPAPVKK